MLCPMHMKLKHVERAIDIQPALITLDHKEPVTPLKTNNFTTEGFINLGMKPKCSKNMGYEVALVERQISSW